MKNTLLKRILVALLASVMLGSSLIGCQNVTESDPETETESETVDRSEAAETVEDIDYQAMTFIEKIRSSNAAISDDLPEYNGEGRTFIIGGMGPAGTSYIDEDGITGEPINDARYNQMLAVSDRFDMEIELQTYTDPDYSISLSDFKKLVLAGDPSAMDLFQTWNTSAAELVSEGSFHELSSLANIDLSKPWYFKDEILDYGYDGKYWMTTGFMCADSVINGMGCIFFNKEIIDTYNITENYYQVVRDGKWTIDYFYDQVNGMYTDLNGDGERDSNDLYGLYFSIYAPSQWILACLGVPQMYLEDGEPKITVFEKTEQAEAIWNKLKQIYLDPSQTQKSWDESTGMINAWPKNRALFYTGVVGNASGMRDYEFDTGILPIFKADEAQKDYYTSYLPSPFAIPTFVREPEISALVMTAMAAEGFKSIVPVAYEQVIKRKLADDYESGEMLDLMLQNVRGDTMFAYGNSRYIFNLMFYLNDDRAQFSSYWASKKSEVTSDMNKLLKKYQKLADNAD